MRVFHIVGTLLTVYAQFIRQPGAYEYLFNSLQSCQIESLLFFPRFSLTNNVIFLFFTSVHFLSFRAIRQLSFFFTIPKYWEKSRIQRDLTRLLRRSLVISIVEESELKERIRILFHRFHGLLNSY